MNIDPSLFDRLRREPSPEVDALAADLLDAAIEVHRALGPGFLESIYEEALCLELAMRAIPFVRQLSVKVHDKGRLVGDARIDLFVADRLLVELKAVENRLRLLSRPRLPAGIESRPPPRPGPTGRKVSAR